MPLPYRSIRSIVCKPLFVAASLLFLMFCSAATASVPLPNTPVGKLGEELIHHLNTDSPEQIAQWLPTILSSAIPSDDQDDFIRQMKLAAHDSGGVDVTDVQIDPGNQPGLLIVAVRAHRGGRCAMFGLTADVKDLSKLRQAQVIPSDPPELYASWPDHVISHDKMTRLIRSKLDTLVRTVDFSGCLTVVTGGEKLFDECRGLADRNFSVPVNHATKFRIGSMDKMFTAVAIAQLVQAGKFSWDSTLAQLVPEYPDRQAAQTITVWQLAHHTAGLGDLFVPEYFEHREKYVNPIDYLDLIARQPKVGEPGKQWSYSNAGFMLLGRIIEDVSGESYLDYVQQHIFAPAGMTSSGFSSISDITPELATGYYHEGLFSTEWKAAWLNDLFMGGPAGGGYSTTTDLILFSEALRTGKLVKPATLAKMFSDEVPAGPGGEAAGFGDRISNGQHIRGHAGGIDGTSANLAMVWKSGATVAITSNEGEFQAAMMLSEHIADLLAMEAKKP